MRRHVGALLLACTLPVWIVSTAVATQVLRHQLGVQDSSARWWDVIRYWSLWRHPALQPFHVELAWSLMLVLCPAVLCLTIGVAVLRRPSTTRNLYGRSRFASRREVRRLGLINPPGASILFGQMGRSRVGFPGQKFMILAAPTRSGKGVGIVIPNLLHFCDSAVVLDIKGENFDLTSGWRQQIGHAVFRFNPFASDARTHRWNPFGYVSHEPDRRIAELSAIAAMLYPDGEPQNKFWIGQARNAFLALSMYLFDRQDRFEEFDHGHSYAPTIGMIYRLSLGDGDDLRSTLRGMVEESFVRDRTRAAMNGLLSQAPDTFASILGTFREPLNAWVDPILDAATSVNDFDLRQLRRTRMTIYVVIPPHRLAEAKLIVNLFFSQVLNLNTQQLPSQDPSLKYQCLLLMDEFTSIGKVEIIAHAVSYMAGYNIRLMPIIQSVAQLDAVYGKELARTLITNHAAQVIFAPREQQDAKDYSEMLGDRSVTKRTRNRGKDSTTSESEERRALMLPQELKAMGPDHAIVLIEGSASPLKLRKLRYYADPEFKRRLLPAITVPALY